MNHDADDVSPLMAHDEAVSLAPLPAVALARLLPVTVNPVGAVRSPQIGVEKSIDDEEDVAATVA